MSATGVPGYPDSVPLFHSLLWNTAGLFWTLTYYLFTRSCRLHRTPSLPLLILVADFSWELFLLYSTPPSLLTSIVYAAWSTTNIFLIWNHVKYGGIKFGDVVIGMVFGVTGMATGLGSFVEWVKRGGVGEEEARMMITVVSGFVLQVGISGWSGVMAMKGRAWGLGWGAWTARLIGTNATAGLIWLRWLEHPEIYWYMASPLMLWVMAAYWAGDLAFLMGKLWVVQDVEVVERRRRVVQFNGNKMK